jgi:hypothetical protein
MRPVLLGAALRRVSLQADYELVEIDQLNDSHAVRLTAAWRF